MTYTYDPEKIGDGGVDQLRFELGDTSVSGGAETCALCDEEYRAILGRTGEDLGQAAYQCLKAIVHRLAYEVDYSVSGLSLSLSQRYPRWKEMLDGMKRRHQAPGATLPCSLDGGHYFYAGMHDNPRAGGLK